MSEESKVRLWIWGGFLSVLILLAVVGAVSYFSFEGTVDKFAESGRVGQSTVQVLLGDRNVASLRSYAKQYLANGDEALLTTYHTRKDSALKALKEALDLTKGADRRQGIQRVTELVVSFDGRFEQSVVLYKKKASQVKEADDIGRKNREKLDEFGKTFHAEAVILEPVETLMRARLDLARVTADYTEGRAKSTTELSAAFAKQVKELLADQPAERRARLAEIATLADGFVTIVAGALDSGRELDRLDDSMDAIGKEISTTTLALRDLQIKRQAVLEEEAGGYVLHAKITIGTLTMIAIGVGIFCAILISTIVSRPIAAMATAARVAEEIGELIKLAAHDGDFRNRTPTEGRTGFVGTISVAVNRLFDSVCDAFAGISRDANTVALAAGDASGAVVEVNAGAAQQAASLEQVREAIRMSAEAITKVSGNAKSAAGAAEKATGLVNRGQITIAELAQLMETIAANGREIAQVTAALGQIATKTDVLATTAAVEAARLGDQGRGFAVIGQQIGQLAEHAGSFSTKIGVLVETANRDLQSGLSAAGSARLVVDDIHRQVVETDGMIRQIAEAMMSQQSAIIEIDATANSLAEIGEHNVQAGEQISQRLVQLRELSDATKDAIAKFKIDKRAA
ncbi:MAG: methyl-accepting chemotaxis protein [Rhodospirillaceae bacterium]